MRRRGHAAFFSEELEGSSPTWLSQKGIEFLQAQAANLFVIMQASNGSVAEVHDLAEHRMINFKMLIFIDEKDTDDYFYRGALTELKTLYNNVETYKYPEDIIKPNWLTKVLEKATSCRWSRIARWKTLNRGV